MQKNSLRRILFFAVIFTVITWSASVILFWVVNSKDTKNLELSAQLEEQNSRKEEIQVLVRDTKNLREDMKEIDNVFLSNDQEHVVSFIENVESIAQVSGADLLIKSVDISDVEQEKLSENFEYVDLKLEVSGGWNKVFHFLNLLENLPNKLIFKESQLTYISDNEGEVGWEGSFNFSVVRIK